MKTLYFSFMVMLLTLTSYPGLAVAMQPGGIPDTRVVRGYLYDIIYGGTCNKNGVCVPDTAPPQCYYEWTGEDMGSIYFAEDCRKGSSCIGYIRCYSTPKPTLGGAYLPLYEATDINGSKNLYLP